MGDVNPKKGEDGVAEKIEEDEKTEGLSEVGADAFFHLGGWRITKKAASIEAAIEKLSNF